MTFKECATLAWKSKPFEPLKHVVLVFLMILGSIILVLGVFVGPPILIEDYFISKDMKGVFLLTIVVYWTILGLLGSLGYKMIEVCKPEEKS